MGCENFLWVGRSVVTSHPLGSERVFEVGMVALDFTNLVVDLGSNHVVGCTRGALYRIFVYHVRRRGVCLGAIYL